MVCRSVHSTKPPIFGGRYADRYLIDKSPARKRTAKKNYERIERAHRHRLIRQYDLRNERLSIVNVTRSVG